MTHKGTITLETERLILCEVDESNMGEVGELKCSVEQRQFTNSPLWALLQTGFSDRKEFRTTYAVCLSDRVIGTLTIERYPDGCRLTDMLIDTSEQRKGFALQTVKLALDILKNDKQYNIVEAHIAPENTASKKLAIKVGFTDKGVKNVGYAEMILLEYTLAENAAFTPEITTCRSATESDYHAIIEMSRVWSSEHITRGLMTNSRESLAGLSLWVAESGGKIAGYCSGMKKYAENYTVFPPNVDYFEVDELYVLPDYRGNNIGEKLLSFVESELKKQGVSHFLLSSATVEQERIAKFYKSCGYGVWTTTFFK